MTISSNVQSFNQAAKQRAENRPKRRKKLPPPFSIRFTNEERERLERAAGMLSLAAYIRLKLFAEDDLPKRMTKKPRQPSAELAVLGHMLGGLGQSKLANNLNQIAKAANTGTLPLGPELEAELREACADIQKMRETLIEALGVQAR